MSIAYFDGENREPPSVKPRLVRNYIFSGSPVMFDKMVFMNLTKLRYYLTS